MTEEHALLEKHLAEGNLDRAESVARHLLGLDPHDVIALVALARLDAARGRSDSAASQLRDLVAENPRHPEPLAYLAVLTWHRGDRAQALSLASRSVALGGDVPPALTLVADDLLDQGEHDRALSLYQRALRRAPSHSGAWLGTARILAFRGELANAEDAYVNAVQHGPQRVEAWVELIRLEREGGAHDVAADNLALALRTHPGHPDLVALARESQAERQDANDPLGTATARIRSRLLARDFAGAMLDLDRLAERFPGEPRLLVVKAEVTAMTGKGQVAPLVHELVRVTRAEPNAWEPKVALGRLLLLPSPVQNPKLAAAHCEDAWRTSGEHPFAGLALVEAWTVVGKHAHARALLAKLAEGDGQEAALARERLEALA